MVAPKKAPNILLIMTDDARLRRSQYLRRGNSTPTMDRLAKTACVQPHVFHSLCSPTRAAQITGRNHHSVGFGVISEQANGFPGYDSVIGVDNATIGRILLENGYATSWFGKDHNTPSYQASQVGPFNQWPTVWVLSTSTGLWRRCQPVGTEPLPQHDPDLPPGKVMRAP